MVLDEVEDFFCIDLSDSGPWSDFENRLGTYRWQAMYATHDHTDVLAESFNPSELHGLEDELADETQFLVRNIERQFHLWVKSVDVSAARQKVKFSDDAIFLSFNYTDTLQIVYGIADERIFHIHGNSANRERLVFGHGRQIVDPPELDESGDSNRTIFWDAEHAAKYPLRAFKKPVSDILAENKKYFDDLCDAGKVIVMGHSLSDVDLPYLARIAKNTDCCWEVCCHTEAKVLESVKQLSKCGVSLGAISYRPY